MLLMPKNKEHHLYEPLNMISIWWRIKLSVTATILNKEVELTPREGV